ncbi:siroheme decarboxylase subunit beta [Candidatus Contubernalis alkaliaceticus]|uniref:siroheme decarboxylase subunit beta n=1 Tax=Candidatus Contubernalis alkaliaceticus TaxID=338645 RepID=UPI001F4BE07D|nr:Lrp/AsnC family transcriptional regulator [Candidatus Contubernalis alkalaceticus]UNC92945.1 Lrp/AsnC family transcriptional regulator [Candidatus Contubernalis alkalaceticus]
MLTNQEKKIVSFLQEDLPLDPRPFENLADSLGIEEEELLVKVKELQDRGLLRRIGAVVRHYHAGYRYNAMGCWQVEESLVDEVGSKMSAYSEISHVYQRPAFPPHWPYNLFTMIHGKSKEECQDTAEKISKETGTKDFNLLYSIKEFKKTSMRYF